VCGFIRDVEFQWDAQLGQKFEHTAELDGGLAMLDVLGELFADASGAGQIVDADVTLAADGAKGQT
jgi:hypothetical protein